jgi:methylenetetrahydrofolate reductase (NADPH)
MIPPIRFTFFNKQRPMSLQNFFQNDKLAISFELFPPKTAAGEATLYKNVAALMEYAPDFITCTYGAGGSTRDKTLEIIEKVKSQFDIPVASHLTLVGSSKDDLRGYLSKAKQQGVDYIVALRGDPPHGETEFKQAAGGLEYANELVELINEEFSDFGVLVAGYPETHKDAVSPEVDLQNLKRKVDAGADAVVTQLFYDNDDFYRFRDRCQAIEINVPIVPGLLPVTSLKQIKKITSMCASKLPQNFVDALSKSDDPKEQYKAGVDLAIEQTSDLIAGGIEAVHFYVLNKSQATSDILRAINVNA